MWSSQWFIALLPGRVCRAGRQQFGKKSTIFFDEKDRIEQELKLWRKLAPMSESFVSNLSLIKSRTQPYNNIYVLFAQKRHFGIVIPTYYKYLDMNLCKLFILRIRYYIASYKFNILLKRVTYLLYWRLQLRFYDTACLLYEIKFKVI